MLYADILNLILMNNNVKLDKNRRTGCIPTKLIIYQLLIALKYWLMVVQNTSSDTVLFVQLSDMQIITLPN